MLCPSSWMLRFLFTSAMDLEWGNVFSPLSLGMLQAGREEGGWRMRCTGVYGQEESRPMGQASNVL